MEIRPGQGVTASLGPGVRKRQPEAEPRDSFAGSAEPSALPRKPHFEKACSGKSPQELGYMWEGSTIGGWVGAALTLVVGHSPLGRWMGLEPPPQREPVVQPLGFEWNGVSDAEFAQRMQGLEKQLEQGKEAGKRRLGGGGNGSYLVELDSGPTTVWKPHARQKPGVARPQIGKVDEGKREAAAYVVDKALGHLARIPCAVPDLDGREGTLCLYVPQGQQAKDFPDKEQLLGKLDPRDYRRIALFDHIIGNLDRHGGNWLVDAKGKPIPIDHGLAFPKQNGNQGTHNFDFAKDFTLDQSEIRMLQGFLGQRPQLEQQLGSLLEKPAVSAMFERVERMLQTGKTDSWWRQ